MWSSANVRLKKSIKYGEIHGASEVYASIDILEDLLRRVIFFSNATVLNYYLNLVQTIHYIQQNIKELKDKQVTFCPHCLLYQENLCSPQTLLFANYYILMIKIPINFFNPSLWWANTVQTWYKRADIQDKLVTFCPQGLALKVEPVCSPDSAFCVQSSLQCRAGWWDKTVLCEHQTCDWCSESELCSMGDTYHRLQHTGVGESFVSNVSVKFSICNVY